MQDWIYEQYIKETSSKVNKPRPMNRDFLLSRGKCCGSGCHNCPYQPPYIKGNMEIFK